MHPRTGYINGVRITAILASVAILLIAGGIVTAVVLSGKLTTQSTPLLSAVLGLAGVLIPALVGLFKLQKLEGRTEAINKKVDGHLTRMTDAMINAGVKPEDIPKPPPDLTAPTDPTKG